MSNKVKKELAVSKKQILAFTDPQVSVGIQVAGLESDAVIPAGTPMAGSLEARMTPFTKAETTDTGTKGVYTVQVTTAAATGDKITIEGVDYECAASEDVAAKKFAGANAAAQVASLLKMVVCDDFDVAADSATDKIKFTQKVAETGNTPAVAVSESATMVVGEVTTVTEAVTGESVNNAVGVLLHDVKVAASDKENGALLIFGFVDLNKLDAEVSIDSAAKKALSGKVTFIK